MSAGRGAGTSLFNLSCSESSSECQWRVLINSCGGRAGMRGYKVAACLLCLSGCHYRCEEWGVECELPGPRTRPQQRLSCERWLEWDWAVGSEESDESESVRDRDLRRRQSLCQHPVLSEAIMWHNRYFVCSVVFIILLRAQADWIVLIEFLVQLFPEIDSDI